MAPKDKSNDEKTPDEERLDSDAEESTGLPNAFAGSGDEDNGEKDAPWREVRHLEIQKPESAPLAPKIRPLRQIRPWRRGVQ